ncbi:hypothetical protein AKJ16_DCAP15590 [Drosera capensis]
MRNRIKNKKYSEREVLEHTIIPIPRVSSDWAKSLYFLAEVPVSLLLFSSLDSLSTFSLFSFIASLSLSSDIADRRRDPDQIAVAGSESNRNRNLFLNDLHVCKIVQ